MPKQTFFNLPEKKRQTLILALEEEFSRVPLYEASISNIVKAACIPRGSFYQYFQDKEDAYNYMLESYIYESKETLVSLLKAHNGDLFLAFAKLFEIILQDTQKEERINFIKNAILNVTHKVENSFTKILIHHGENEGVEEVIHLIDRSKLNTVNESELFHVLQIIIAVIFRNFVEKYTKSLSDEEAIKGFQTELKLLKQGLYKKSESK